MKKLPCTIDGIDYESENEAARTLGLDTGTLRMRLKSSNYPEYISKHHLKKKRRKGVYTRKPRGYKRCPCTIKGIRYESEIVAANTLGIRVDILRSRFRSSNYPEYISKYHSKIQRKRRFRFRCTIKGVEYASVSEATKKLKMNPNTLFNRLKSFDYPDYVCADIPKVSKPPKPIKYNYTVNGKKYRSLQEIGDMEGLTRERIRQKMNDPKKPEYQRL